MRHTILLALLAVSACGTSTETFTFNGQDVTRAEFEELTGDGPVISASDDPTGFAIGNLQDKFDAAGLDALSNSSFDTVNNQTGEATFTGVLDIATRGIPGREYNMLTQADITVDFDSDSLVSTFGEAVVLNTNNEVVANPNANFTVTNGTIGGTRANAVSLELSGGLTALDFSATVQADLEGSLLGTPIVGLTATDTSPLVIVDGAGTPTATVTLEALAD